MKKLVLLALTLTLAFFVPLKSVSANPFPDLDQVSWAKEEIVYLNKEGIINGLPDGTFGPKENITRAQVAVMLVRDLFPDETPNEVPPFSDLEKGKYYYEAIAVAYDKGILKGSNGKVRPTDYISRAEAAVMVDRAYDISRKGHVSGLPDAQDIPWATESIMDLNSRNIINGTPDGDFKPFKDITRAEFSKVLAATIEPSFRSGETESMAITKDLMTSQSDSDDVHWNQWSSDSMFTMSNEKIASKGVGFEPHSSYSSHPYRMYTEFYIEEFQYTTFEATVSLEKEWSTGDNGITEAVVYADSKKIYTKQFENSTELENIKVAIPKGTKELTLYAIQQEGAQGNHGLIFSNPRLTNALEQEESIDQIELSTIGTASYNDADDIYYGDWDDYPLQMKEGNLLARGYGFEPHHSYSSNPNRMYRKFYVKDYSYTTLETTISIDSKWDMGDRGETQAVIFADGKEIYSKKFTNTSSSESVKVQIPKGTSYITLYALQNKGSQGNHGLIYENPILTNELPSVNPEDVMTLNKLGSAKESDSDDVHYGSWHSGNTKAMSIDGELVARGYGFEPHMSYGNYSNMYYDFYVGDYDYNTFKTTIALDSHYSAGNFGSTTAFVLADGEVLYQGTFDNSNTREDIEVDIPKGTKYLRIKASMEPGDGGNNAIIFNESELTY